MLTDIRDRGNLCAFLLHPIRKDVIGRRRNVYAVAVHRRDTVGSTVAGDNLCHTAAAIDIVLDRDGTGRIVTNGDRHPELRIAGGHRIFKTTVLQQTIIGCRNRLIHDPLIHIDRSAGNNQPRIDICGIVIGGEIHRDLFPAVSRTGNRIIAARPERSRRGIAAALRMLTNHRMNRRRRRFDSYHIGNTIIRGGFYGDLVTFRYMEDVRTGRCGDGNRRLTGKRLIRCLRKRTRAGAVRTKAGEADQSARLSTLEAAVEDHTLVDDLNLLLLGKRNIVKVSRTVCYGQPKINVFRIRIRREGRFDLLPIRRTADAMLRQRQKSVRGVTHRLVMLTDIRDRGNLATYRLHPIGEIVGSATFHLDDTVSIHRGYGIHTVGNHFRHLAAARGIRCQQRRSGAVVQRKRHPVVRVSADFATFEVAVMHKFFFGTDKDNAFRQEATKEHNHCQKQREVSFGNFHQFSHSIPPENNHFHKYFTKSPFIFRYIFFGKRYAFFVFKCLYS